MTLMRQCPLLSAFFVCSDPTQLMPQSHNAALGGRPGSFCSRFGRYSLV